MADPLDGRILIRHPDYGDLVSLAAARAAVAHAEGDRVPLITEDGQWYWSQERGAFAASDDHDPAGGRSRPVRGGPAVTARQEGIAQPAGGVWLAYHGDWSGWVVFAAEIEALRHAVDHSMRVKFLKYGEDPVDR
jgi:hypothetical protein